MKTVWMVAAVLLALGLAGCDKSDDAETARGDGDETEVTDGRTGTSADTDDNGDSGGRPDISWTGDGKVRITDPETGATIEGGPEGTVDLPDGFPEDVHVYENGELLVAVRHDANNFSLTLHTSDAPKTVIDTYARKVAADGWQEEQAMNMPSHMIRAYKKGNRHLGLTVVRSNDTTALSLTVATED